MYASCSYEVYTSNRLAQFNQLASVEGHCRHDVLPVRQGRQQDAEMRIYPAEISVLLPTVQQSRLEYVA